MPSPTSKSYKLSGRRYNNMTTKMSIVNIDPGWKAVTGDLIRWSDKQRVPSKLFIDYWHRLVKLETSEEATVELKQIKAQFECDHGRF
jgi:hypothetical protein